jgi:hypothetical protein
MADRENNSFTYIISSVPPVDSFIYNSFADRFTLKPINWDQVTTY